MFNRIQLFLGRALTLDAEDLKREEGQTATEYAVVLGVIVVGLGGAAVVLRGKIIDYITAVGNLLNGLLSL
jgi:Flp pilus assembly pilin Flp